MSANTHLPRILCSYYVTGCPWCVRGRELTTCLYVSPFRQCILNKYISWSVILMGWRIVFEFYVNIYTDINYCYTCHHLSISFYFIFTLSNIFKLTFILVLGVILLASEVNPAMVSTVRFYDRNELDGSPAAINCQMPNFLGWAFSYISLISIN